MTEINYKAMQGARDEAISVVDENANETWKALAIQAVRNICRTKNRFIIDDIRVELEKLTTLSTHDYRALGPIMLRANKDNLCRRTKDYMLSAQVQCHGNPRVVWESLTYESQANSAG